MSSSKTAVLVAGSWGTALAAVLADNGHHVRLWTRNAEQAAEMNETRQNNRFLPGETLSERIRATTSIEEAVSGAKAVVLASTSSAMREVTAKLRPHLPAGALLVHAAKGFEADSMKRMSEIIAEELPDADSQRIVVLSGPSHAEEVIRRCPTTVVVAANDITAAEHAQDLFINSYFRVYTNPDLVGVEIAGALKNIIALGAGMTNGLGFGDNAKAALITRGLAEISRLGQAIGANPMTFAGLAGVGDLIVTCTSTLSRNWRAGYLLGSGHSVDEVLEKVGMVVEGIKTTRTAQMLSRQYNVVMPITEELFQVLFNGKEPKLAVEHLMGRVKTHELEEVADLNKD